MIKTRKTGRWPVRARAEDAPGIAALLEASAPVTVPVPLVDVLAHIDCHLVVRDEDGAVVACVARHETQDVAELRSLAVADDHRGEGLAARLVSEVLWLSAVAGTPVRCVTIEPDFFARFGFSPTGTPPRPRPAHAPPLDDDVRRVVMECASPITYFATKTFVT